MKYSMIIVDSVTYAMKAKSELSRQGISCRVEKIKKVSNYQGCGYGVIVKNIDLEMSSSILFASAINIIDIINL